MITPAQQEISIQVPKHFIGRQVEVIAFTIDDTAEDSAAADKPFTHLASEQALAKDWLTIEEDAAWQHLADC